MDAWHSVLAARHHEVIDNSELEAFLADVDGRAVGIATVDVRGPDYEVVSISTALPGRGVGQALLGACVDDARARGCRRVWLVTTNNNVRAIDFYQRFGMDLCAFHRDAVRDARRLKPEIPLYDDEGISIAHELDFELVLRD
jgi:GNAT superfamily N-acetyltransferase